MIVKDSKIAVIGAGAWGTAIANLVAKNSFQTFLITNNKENVSEIEKTRLNEKYLPKVKLSKNLKIEFGITEKNLKEVDFIFIVTPSQAVEKVFKEISFLKLKKDVKFVICSKGLDGNKLKFFSEIFSDILPKYKFAVLSGPNFAIEVGLEVPTVTTIASKNKVLAKEVIKILNNNYFLAEYSKDVITTEISAVLKNVMAIGCGIIDGLDLGQNAKAALVKKGIDEILLLCKKLKGKGELTNSAGFGDIFLTCSTTKSRNNLLGFEIAKGKTYSEVSKNLNKTFEGAVSVKSIVKLAKKKKIELKLCQAIDEILTKNYSTKEIQEKITKAIIS
ncbi:MAG: NAD(P)H-dependent glycerol-3-phosphate dehydrogenase [Pelagibacterales bacterium]|nr:NAD(P)H-dependent glycerol-3-phosphate dehydrogenase [Pelagibacterales bacterium]